MAVILVGVALLVGAVALVSVMRSALTESVRVDAQARASDVVADLEGGTAPGDLVMPTTDDLLIQVLDARWARPGGQYGSAADGPRARPGVGPFRGGRAAR